MKPLLLAHRLLSRLTAPLCALWAAIQLRLWGASVGDGLRVHGRLRVLNYGRMKIGRDVRMNSGAHNYVGIDRRLSLWTGPKGSIQIGDQCAISNSTFVALEGITLLPRTFVGGGCEFFDSDMHSLEPAARTARQGEVSSSAIVIGPDAFVGAGTMVLKGVSIGEGAVIGAGSLVTKAVPARELWAGRPARKIRDLQ